MDFVKRHILTSSLPSMESKTSFLKVEARRSYQLYLNWLFPSKVRKSLLYTMSKGCYCKFNLLPVTNCNAVYAKTANSQITTAVMAGSKSTYCLWRTTAHLEAFTGCFNKFWMPKSLNMRILKKNNRQIEGTFGRLSQYVNTLSRIFFVVFRNQNMMGHPEHILIEQTTIFIFFFHP